MPANNLNSRVADTNQDESCEFPAHHFLLFFDVFMTNAFHNRAAGGYWSGRADTPDVHTNWVSSHVRGVACRIVYRRGTTRFYCKVHKNRPLQMLRHWFWIEAA